MFKDVGVGTVKETLVSKTIERTVMNSYDVKSYVYVK